MQVEAMAGPTTRPSSAPKYNNKVCRQKQQRDQSGTSHNAQVTTTGQLEVALTQHTLETAQVRPECVSPQLNYSGWFTYQISILQATLRIAPVAEWPNYLHKKHHVTRRAAK
jgi:hypothetical protein